MHGQRTRSLVQRLPSGEERLAVRSSLETVIGRAFILHEKTGAPTWVEDKGVVVADFPYDLLACRSCTFFNPTPLAFLAQASESVPQ